MYCKREMAFLSSFIDIHTVNRRFYSIHPTWTILTPAPGLDLSKRNQSICDV